MKPLTVPSQCSHVPGSSLTQCSRCNGLLVHTYVDRIDMSESTIPGTPIFLGRCVNCGECVDGRILANRLMKKQPQRGPRHPPSLQEMQKVFCSRTQLPESLTKKPEVPR